MSKNKKIGEQSARTGRQIYETNLISWKRVRPGYLVWSKTDSLWRYKDEEGIIHILYPGLGYEDYVNYAEFEADTGEIILEGEGRAGAQVNIDGRYFLIEDMQGPVNERVYGTVVWIEDLDFWVTECGYWIQGERFRSPPADLTLTPSDPILNRIDVFYVDVNSMAGFITGVPAADPAKPTIDPITQLELTSVLIPAGATEPDGMTNELVYDENLGTPAEWDTSLGIVPSPDREVDFDYTTDPYQGTKCVRMYNSSGGSISGNNARFTNDAPISLVGNTISFWLKTNKNWRNTSRLNIYFWNGGEWIKSWGFQRGVNNPGFNDRSRQWQRVAFSIDAMPLYGSSNIADIIQLTPSGSWRNGTELYFDVIELKGGTTPAPSLYDTYIRLRDTDNDYAGHAGETIVVNQTEDGQFFNDRITDDGITIKLETGAPLEYIRETMDASDYTLNLWRDAGGGQTYSTEVSSYAGRFRIYGERTGFAPGTLSGEFDHQLGATHFTHTDGVVFGQLYIGSSLYQLELTDTGHPGEETRLNVNYGLYYLVTPHFNVNNRITDNGADIVLDGSGLTYDSKALINQSNVLIESANVFGRSYVHLTGQVGTFTKQNADGSRGDLWMNDDYTSIGFTLGVNKSYVDVAEDDVIIRHEDGVNEQNLIVDATSIYMPDLTIAQINAKGNTSAVTREYVLSVSGGGMPAPVNTNTLVASGGAWVASDRITDDGTYINIGTVAGGFKTAPGIAAIYGSDGVADISGFGAEDEFSEIFSGSASDRISLIISPVLAYFRDNSYPISKITNPQSVATREYVLQETGGGIPTGTNTQTLRNNAGVWEASDKITNTGVHVTICETSDDAYLRVDPNSPWIYGYVQEAGGGGAVHFQQQSPKDYIVELTDSGGIMSRLDMSTNFGRNYWRYDNGASIQQITVNGTSIVFDHLTVAQIVAQGDDSAVTKEYVDPVFVDVDAATYSTNSPTKQKVILHVTYTGTGAVAITMSTADMIVAKEFVIKDAGGNAGTFNITIDTQGAEKIDGENTLVIDSDYASFTLYSDGAHWFIT